LPYRRPSRRRSRLQWLTSLTALQPCNLPATPMSHRARHHFNKHCTVALPLLCNSATLPERNGRLQSLFTPQHPASRAENREIHPVQPQNSDDRCTVARENGGKYPLPLHKIVERGEGDPSPLKLMQQCNTLEKTQRSGSPYAQRLATCSLCITLRDVMGYGGY